MYGFCWYHTTYELHTPYIENLSFLTISSLFLSSSFLSFSVKGIYLVKMAKNRRGSGMEEYEVVSVRFLSGDC